MRKGDSRQSGRKFPAQYRQGNVLLSQVKKVRTRSEPLPAEVGRVVVAEGEHSGHAHALAPELAGLFRRGREVLLRVAEGGAALSHEENAPIAMPEGDYQIRRQREYDPQASRPAADLFVRRRLPPRSWSRFRNLSRAGPGSASRRS
jgi:hypothetical protein